LQVDSSALSEWIAQQKLPHPEKVVQDQLFSLKYWSDQVYRSFQQELRESRSLNPSHLWDPLNKITLVNNCPVEFLQIRSLLLILLLTQAW